jgi:hypothetical protein
MPDGCNPSPGRKFDELLASEIAALPPDLRERFERYRVVPWQAVLQWGIRSGGKVFVVAQADEIAVYFDDVEEEFAVGRISEGEIFGAGLIGELRYAMYEFPERYRVGLSK